MEVHKGEKSMNRNLNRSDTFVNRHRQSTPKANRNSMETANGDGAGTPHPIVGNWNTDDANRAAITSS